MSQLFIKDALSQSEVHPNVEPLSEYHVGHELANWASGASEAQYNKYVKKVDEVKTEKEKKKCLDEIEEVIFHLKTVIHGSGAQVHFFGTISPFIREHRAKEFLPKFQNLYSKLKAKKVAKEGLHEGAIEGMKHSTITYVSGASEGRYNALVKAVESMKTQHDKDRVVQDIDKELAYIGNISHNQVSHNIGSLGINYLLRVDKAKAYVPKYKALLAKAKAKKVVQTESSMYENTDEEPTLYTRFTDSITNLMNIAERKLTGYSVGEIDSLAKKAKRIKSEKDKREVLAQIHSAEEKAKETLNKTKDEGKKVELKLQLQVLSELKNKVKSFNVLDDESREKEHHFNSNKEKIKLDAY